MRNTMKMNRPAGLFNANWREGIPLGNGILGALVYGYMTYERIMLSDTFLWRGDYQSEMPYVGDLLPKMQELILAGRMTEADNMLTQALIDRGYRVKESLPIPTCDIRLELPLGDSFSGYERELDMDTAQAFVRYRSDGRDFQRRVFVSRKDDVVVIDAEKDTEVSIEVHASDEAKPQFVTTPKLGEYASIGQWRYFYAVEDDREHGAVARVITGDRTLVLAKVFHDGEHEEQWKTLKGELEKLEGDYDGLLQRHIPAHQQLFSSVKIEIDDEKYGEDTLNSVLLDEAYENEMPNELARRMWAYGRYLLVCSAVEGGNPCPLMGLWNGEYQAFWAFNMANINIQMIYWQTLGGNLASLMLTVFDYYEKRMDDMRLCARQMFNCGGIFLTAVSNPDTLKHICVMPHITNWTGGAGWISQLYYDYYTYTRDEEFLKNRAYPFMREAARFYEDFLVWQEGKWLVVPSVSPENRTKNYKNEGIVIPELTQASINATMDIAIIRELFSHLLEIGLQCGAGGEEMAAWREIIENAPEYSVNGDGAVREWQHPDYPDNYEHRHQSHLYPVFPGLEMARNEEMRGRFHQGAIMRLTKGIAWQTSWSLAQTANTMARCRDGENAWKALNLISKTTLLGNLFTVHNDWRENGITMRMSQAPFQIDADMGWTSAVQEMLLYSDTQRVEPLPALPKRWKSGRAYGLMTRALVKVDMEWSGCSVSLTLTAMGDTSFELRLPSGETHAVEMAKGETQSCHFLMENT